jgi:hypothetical protein
VDEFANMDEISTEGVTRVRSSGEDIVEALNPDRGTFIWIAEEQRGGRGGAGGLRSVFLLLVLLAVVVLEQNGRVAFPHSGPSDILLFLLLDTAVRGGRWRWKWMDVVWSDVDTLLL